MPRSFDNLARPYAVLEHLLFGRKLEQARDFHLEALDTRKPGKALILGEGDGRFTYKALHTNPKLSVDSIEQSFEMRRLAQSRIEKLGNRGKDRYCQIKNDALQYSFPQNEYDFVITQFFLDCFRTENANQLIVGINRALKVEGKFLYLDFSIPNGRSTYWLSHGLVAFLYLFFRATTNIEARSLPLLSWPKSLEARSKRRLMKGLLTCETRTKILSRNQRTSLGSLS